MGVELAIGPIGLDCVGPIIGWAKIGPNFLGENFSSPARPKNRTGRSK